MAMSAPQVLAYTSYVNELFGRFIERISDNHQIPESDLWDILNLACAVEEVPIKTPPPVRIKLLEVSECTPEDSPAREACIAVLKSGARKGEDCGKKISDKSKTHKYCGVHAKLENTLEAIRKDEEEDLGGLLFKKNRFGNFTFGDTGLVLKSEADPRIIGKQYHDGTIVSLDVDDIALCKLRRLKYSEVYVPPK